MIRFAVVKVPNEPLKVIPVSPGKTPEEMLKESGYIPGPFCYSVGPLYNTQQEAAEALMLEADPVAGALGKPGANG